MPAAAPEHPEWQARYRAARDGFAPWIEHAVGLAGRTVLEYGCGQGAIACAVAPRVGRHIGVDILDAELALARGHLDDRALQRVELVGAPPSSILERVADFRGEVDVFLCYAVLEHLTVEERLAVLRLAREVTRADGHLVIVETPNRLTPIDHHTGRMPFLHALPEQLSEQYYSRSDRPDFVEAIDAAAAGGGAAGRREALARWGTGMSYHELEIVFGDLAAHTVASSYDERLYSWRPVRGEELALAATLEAWRPELAPCWSRTWIDTILSMQPLRPHQRRPFVRPWALRLPHDTAGAAMLADGRVELRPGARLPVDLPAPSRTLHVGLQAGRPAEALRVHAAGHELLVAAVPNHDSVPPWHAVVVLPEPAAQVEVSLIDGGCITYVGHDGGADPDAAVRRPMGW